MRNKSENFNKANNKYVLVFSLFLGVMIWIRVTTLFSTNISASFGHFLKEDSMKNIQKEKNK